jgi:Zn-dependent membrane protease YugP
MLPAFIIMMITSAYVKSAYNKWSKVQASSRLTGAQAAERLISSGGLYGVRVEGIRGNLTDHYDPRDKVLRLSEGVYQSPSVAAVAIAAHELGHAMQDNEATSRCLPPRCPRSISALTWAGSDLRGLLLKLPTWPGWLLVFSGGALFVATLPVELNASAAPNSLLNAGVIYSPESRAASTRYSTCCTHLRGCPDHFGDAAALLPRWSSAWADGGAANPSLSTSSTSRVESAGGFH